MRKQKNSEKYFTAPEVGRLAEDLNEQGLIINEHLERCAMLKLQIKHIPRLAVNREKIRMLRSMLKETRENMQKHASLRSKIADDLCRYYQSAQPRRPWWQESCEFLLALLRQVLQERKIVARISKANR